MYLSRIVITAILFLSANLYGVSALHEPMFRKATPARFVYYYRTFKVPANFKPGSADLKHEARRAWNDLVWQYDNYDTMRVGTYKRPRMVAAMYDPDTSMMIVASSVVSANARPGNWATSQCQNWLSPGPIAPTGDWSPCTGRPRRSLAHRPPDRRILRRDRLPGHIFFELIRINLMRRSVV